MIRKSEIILKIQERYLVKEKRRGKGYKGYRRITSLKRKKIRKGKRLEKKP